MTFEEKLKKYALLCIKIGVNLQKGQKLIVQCPIEHGELARILAETAYKEGAKEVVTLYTDEKMSKIQYEYAADEYFETVPTWKKELLNGYAKEGAALVNIMSGDPEIFKDVDPKKLSAELKAKKTELQDFYEEYTYKQRSQWNIIAAPNPKWAKMVFPNDTDEVAVSKLWDAIFESIFMSDGDIIEKWNEHNDMLKKRRKYLTDMQFKKLHYVNSIGTDFVVNLAQNHIWLGGGDNTSKGVLFFPNIPTQEVFTAPDCRYAEGKLVSSLPLSYQGKLIRDFTLWFKDGKVVDYSAVEGYETLKMLLDTDEGSKRLGEVALVPFDSAISNMKTLFYNTLFDENASCHFALGRCYPSTISGGDNLSAEELQEIGGNGSINHVDFMVGTEDLTIKGITDAGEEVTIFRNGNWAIDN